MITFFRIIKFGIQGFWRNIVLSFNATFIMTLTLITLSIFFILNIVVTSSTGKLEEKLDITITLIDQATEQEVADFIKIIDAKPEVKKLEYINKDKLLKEWRDLFTKQPEFRDLITKQDNPLLREVRVWAYDSDNLQKISTFAEKKEFDLIVNSVSYRENQSKIKEIINYSKFLRKISLIMSLVFTGIALFVILPTILLAIYSRREEIEIMRFVGATSLLIRAPFIFEGILYGVLATIFAEIMAIAAIWGIQSLENQYLGSAGGSIIFGNSNDSFLHLYQQYIWSILLVHLICGVLIGIVSSYIAVRKYLK